MKTIYCNSADTKRARHRSLATVGVMAALLVGAAGCATVYRTSPGSLASMGYQGASSTPTELVYITTTGYHFMWSVPLLSGDLRWNASKQSINLKIAESRHCDVIDMVFDDSDTSYADVSYGGIIGLFFGSSHIGLSGVLVPKQPQPETQEGSEKKEGGC